MYMNGWLASSGGPDDLSLAFEIREYLKESESESERKWNAYEV